MCQKLFSHDIAVEGTMDLGHPLEELGIKPKRVAGASVGAIIAVLVAADLSAEEIKDVMAINLKNVMLG